MHNAPKRAHAAIKAAHLLVELEHNPTRAKFDAFIVFAVRNSVTAKAIQKARPSHQPCIAHTLEHVHNAVQPSG